jgi:very-short-patch-repair endonuclease
MNDKEYWSQIGEQAKQARVVREAGQLSRRNVKLLRSNKIVQKNKRRWPKGSWEVAQFLRLNKIRFVREHVIDLPGGTFYMVDFMIPQFKVFLELDGPEHDAARDRVRELRILEKPQFKGWQFVRYSSDEARSYIRACLEAIRG